MSWDLARPVEQVAPELLGSVLRHGEVAVRLTEVEAYDGAHDPASHAFRGRTPRNAIMFGPPGHLYVYFSYGMHWAANIICGPDGHASGVLLRSGEVVDGVEVARSRRGRAIDRDLARGPGRLTQALGIRIEHRGACLLDGGPVRLEPGLPRNRSAADRGSGCRPRRIGPGGSGSPAAGSSRTTSATRGRRLRPDSREISFDSCQMAALDSGCRCNRFGWVGH